MCSSVNFSILHQIQSASLIDFLHQSALWTTLAGWIAVTDEQMKTVEMAPPSWFTPFSRRYIFVPRLDILIFSAYYRLKMLFQTFLDLFSLAYDKTSFWWISWKVERVSQELHALKMQSLTHASLSTRTNLFTEASVRRAWVIKKKNRRGFIDHQLRRLIWPGTGRSNRNVWFLYHVHCARTLSYR